MITKKKREFMQKKKMEKKKIEKIIRQAEQMQNKKIEMVDIGWSFSFVSSCACDVLTRNVNQTLDHRLARSRQEPAPFLGQMLSEGQTNENLVLGTDHPVAVPTYSQRAMNPMYASKPRTAKIENNHHDWSRTADRSSTPVIGKELY